MIALVVSAGVVLLAEMGDKTQLLALAFCARYRPAQVMTGIFAGAILNSLLAAGTGRWLASFSHLTVWIQGLASLSFLVFGLLALGGKEEGSPGISSGVGAIFAVAIAFFIAELGDKTQLATVALAARFPASFWLVALGSTLGLLGANGLGVWAGSAICQRISQRTINRAAASAFILCGLISGFQTGVSHFGLPLTWALLGAVLLGLVTGFAAWQLDSRVQPRGICTIERACPPQDKPIKI
jgi:putative Ca2+/H+ antiporter (TMEM165/GDT1 family)